MQMLDQQIPPQIARPQQRLHLRQRSRIDLSSFREIRPASTPRTGMDAPVVMLHRTRASIQHRPLHRPLVVQSRDVVLIVAEPTEDFVGVLAEEWRTLYVDR